MPQIDFTKLPDQRKIDLTGLPDKSPGIDLSSLPDNSEDALSMAATFDIPPSQAYENYDAIKKSMDDRNLHGKAFMSGIGQTYATAGSALKWMGLDEQAEVYGDFGKRLQKAYSFPMNQGDVSWRNLSDSRWWATNITQSIPFTLSLIPAGILAAYAGGATAGVIGLGTFGRTVLGSLSAALVSRPMESALEAGGVYEEKLRQSGDEAKASESADTTFWMNMGLTGQDAAEFALAFTPLRVLGKSATKSLTRRILATGGKLAGVGAMEAGEEAVQEGISQHALGKEIDFTAMKTPAFVGGLFGVGMGGTGSVYTALRDKVVDTMPPDMKTTVDTAIKEGLEAGLPQQQAELKALDEVAETPEGKEHIEKVMETLKDPEKVEEVKEPEKVAPEPAEGAEKVYVHETDAAFDKFDISKAGTGQGEAWLGRGIYLNEKGSFKIETYGKNKVEATLKPEANIFEVKTTPEGKFRDTFVEYAVENNIGNARGLAEQRAKEGLSLQNLLPRDPSKPKL